MINHNYLFTKKRHLSNPWHRSYRNNRSSGRQMPAGSSIAIIRIMVYFVWMLTFFTNKCCPKAFWVNKYSFINCIISLAQKRLHLKGDHSGCTFVAVKSFTTYEWKKAGAPKKKYRIPRARLMEITIVSITMVRFWEIVMASNLCISPKRLMVFSILLKAVSPFII